MELARRNLLVYVMLGAVWLLVLAWQVEEHLRVRQSARTVLRNRSKVIANTLSACIRGLRFRGTVLTERLEPVLNELVSRTNELGQSSELISVVLLNAANEPVAQAGKPIDPEQKEITQTGERWGVRSVAFVNPVDLGASLSAEGLTNPTVVLPSPFPHPTNRPAESFRGRGFPRREPRPEDVDPPPRPPDDKRMRAEGTNASSNLVADAGPSPPSDGRGTRGEGPRRPFWLRGMDEKEYQSLIEKRAVHGLVLALSTESFQAACRQDLWLRSIILLLATVSVFGSGLAWSNLAKSSDLQLRLVRASELTTHLKEMNLAAAGLAHETRNPLNIIRGLAQMVSKHPATGPEIQRTSRQIVEEADKVAAQVNEFINYSRPREVRPSVLALGSVVGEVIRALSYDLEEKKIRIEVKDEHLSIEADEQLLRQALFNLLLNAIQAVNGAGAIQVIAERRTAAEATLEVRDNGPGVPADRRSEIFKPYFTTQKTGTGLGLAVVQQIVLAHGWEIECLPNDPHGAVFRITHLKLAG